MNLSRSNRPESPRPALRRHVPAVGPGLRRLLTVVFALFALLSVNATYLVGVTLLEWATHQTYQNWFYLVMFLVHLVLGLSLILPFLVFGLIHIRNTLRRPNRRAVYVGFALFAVALGLVVSGLILTRIEGVIVVKNPAVRSVAYWTHVLSPIAAAWLFVLHRLAGRRIQWRIGARWAVVAVGFAALMMVVQAQDPRRWNQEGPATGEQYFFPSLARTASGEFISPRVLMNDQYCKECHEDTHETWSVSAHRFASFNNPAYFFSVQETRQVSLERDGSVQAARFCAGCHDPVVFFGGKFDDPSFDDINDPTAQAGITCTACHAITHLNSVRGNADYTIDEPIHYPFAFSDNPALGWINRQLVKAKPEFHKKTFLKPLHQTEEFCGTCHKVHLPVELNNYKWLRGQNHYDSFLLSGVSGHGVASFYYPEQAEPNCNGCHMELLASDQFSAQDFDGSGTPKIHDHQFPSANTAVLRMLDQPESAILRHAKFNEGVMRVDIFGIKQGGTIDGELTAPIRPEIPTLRPGGTYLLETVIRTVEMGHHFTQGTSDSNEIWLDVTVTSGETDVGRSGGLEADGSVDPWSYFVNSFVLDRAGNRIDRRNAQDIFVALYDHQIPPGAADVVHYRLLVPPDARLPVTVEVALRYRKFDTAFMQHIYGEDYINELPIMTLARDSVTFPVGDSAIVPTGENPVPGLPEWQRWNDYGIGLLRKGGKSKGELRQAEAAFTRVEALERPDGPLNLARVYLAQGTVQDRAIGALDRAARFEPPAPAWSVAWFTGQVNKQNGFLDEAIANFESILELDDEETRRRGFDFSRDYRLLNELGQTLFERAKQERGPARSDARQALLWHARDVFLSALQQDPENVSAHFNLDLIYKQLDEPEKAAEHFDLYQTYKPDDNSHDSAIAAQRASNPAADHAAEAIAIYDLQRPGAYLQDPVTIEVGEPTHQEPGEVP
ncbi:MAG: multiheme c-type cytochrome [Thermoanaerobaculia bacterium]|jgi:hypothetical protein